jgi:hypothetical protein
VIKFSALLITTIFLFGSISARAGRKKIQCHEHVLHPLTQTPVGANLPFESRAGLAVAGRVVYDNFNAPGTIRRTLNIVVPLPNRRQEELIDLARFSFREPLPDRFIVGDGSSERALVGVDTTPGSYLSLWLERIHSQIDRFHLEGTFSIRKLAEILVNHVAYNMGMVVETGMLNKQLPWDAAFPSFPPHNLILTNEPDGHSPIPLDFKMPVVPLDWYVGALKGYCLQQGILASLILRAYGVHHRLVNGAMAYVGKDEQLNPDLLTPGHTWIQLQTGEILDLGRRKFAHPVRLGAADVGDRAPSQAFEQDWMHIPGDYEWVDGEEKNVWRFEYDRYLALRLEPLKKRKAG